MTQANRLALSWSKQLRGHPQVKGQAFTPARTLRDQIKGGCSSDRRAMPKPAPQQSRPGCSVFHHNTHLRLRSRFVLLSHNRQTQRRGEDEELTSVCDVNHERGDAHGSCLRWRIRLGKYNKSILKLIWVINITQCSAVRRLCLHNGLTTFWFVLPELL